MPIPKLKFDEWYRFQKVTFARKLKRKGTLKKFISFEKVVMETFKGVTVVPKSEISSITNPLAEPQTSFNYHVKNISITKYN